MAIAIIVCLIAFSIMLGDLAFGVSALSTVAMLYLPPLFFAWATVGWLVRRQTRMIRMVINLLISSFGVAGLTIFILSQFGSSTSASDAAQWTLLSVILASACVAGGLVTYLVLLRPARPKL